MQLIFINMSNPFVLLLSSIIHFWNYAASIVFTCKSVIKRLCAFITVITQIKIFSLNSGTSNKNFETTKYFKIFSEKHFVLTLNVQHGGFCVID